MISIPLWLFVGQWLLLCVCFFTVYSCYRQIRLESGFKQGEMCREGLEIGSQAPDFSFNPVNRLGGDSPARFDARGRWTFLLFAHPDCADGQEALLMLERLVAGSTGKIIYAFVVTTADRACIEASEVFSSTPLDIGRVNSDVLRKLYRTRNLPFAYVIDPEGSIRSKGVVSSDLAARGLLSSSDRALV